jgi:Ni/Fe-hydrogenase subunit HybB-like protein
VYTIFAWDFVMSLDPAWSSTLFGGYYFVGNLYLGLAAVTALTVFTSRRHGLDHSVDSKVFHNLGKLLFCFALLWTYLFWSQYLVIWYGNLPRETRFLLVRTAQEPWSTLALAVLLANFLIPFVILLFRAARKSRQALLAVSAAIVAGMWLERFLLVAPSLSPGQRLFLGWQELAITAGFFALFLLTYMIALRGVSLLARRTSGDSQ